MEVRFELWHCLLDGALKTRADGVKGGLLRGWFGEVVIRAEVHSGTNVGLLAFGREEDERDSDGLCVSAKCSDHAIAVQFRHHHVAKNEVGLLLLRQLDSDSAVLGGQCAKLLQPEDGHQVAAHLWFVFNYQNLFHNCVCIPVLTDRTFRWRCSGRFTAGLPTRLRPLTAG